MLILKLIFKEISNKKRWTAFFILNLIFAFLSLIVTETFKESVDTYFQSNSKNILGADLSISSRRALTQQEYDLVQKSLVEPKQESILFDFYGMLLVNNQSRLVLVKAVDSLFPLYGELELESGKKINSKSVKEIIASKKIWIQPELKYQLNLKLDDEVHLGKLKLQVSDVVNRDSSQTFRFANLAPRVYIDRALLEESGLIQFGSTYTQSYLYKFSQESIADSVRENLLKKIIDPGVQIETPTSTGGNSGQQLKYLGDYFGLVSLVAILISTIGLIYIFRMQISENLKNMAVYNVFGFSFSNIVKVILGQIAIYSFVAFVISLLLVKAVIPYSLLMFTEVLPKDFKFILNYFQVSVVYILIYLGLILSILPYLFSLKKIKPSLLLKEGGDNISLEINHYYLFLPALILLWIVSVAQSHSIKMGSIFFFSLLGVVSSLSLLAIFVFVLLRKYKFKLNWNISYSMQSLLRNPAPSISLFLTLAISVILINLIPQIEQSIKKDVLFNPKETSPDLFMFDLQDEQLNQFKSVIKSNASEVLGLSPIIRGRILKLNGLDFERKVEDGSFKTREEETEIRFRNRGVNLSIRDELSSTEQIIKGRPFLGTYDSNKKDKAEISIEYKYAERMGISLGDILTFDVQGVSIEARVVNFRKVRWSSFYPNFFIIFQPGVLDDAPKSYVAAIKTLNQANLISIQSELAKSLPNISIIDVKSALKEILSLTEKMTFALELLAYLVLISGFVILFIIIRQHFIAQQWSINLFKVLGASRSDLLLYSFTQIGTLGLSGLTCGLILSQVINYIIITYGLDIESIIRLETPLKVLVATLALSMLIGFLAVRKIISRRPIELLRN